MVATSIASPPPSSGGLPPHLLSTTTNSIIIDQKKPPWKSQAVNRTNELLSCARTALKIGQQQHRQRLQQQQLQEQGQQQQGSLLFPSKSSTNNKNDEFPEWLVDINPAQLTLYQPPPPSFNHLHDTTNNNNNNDSTTSLLSDSQSLLSLLDNNLSQLHSLVRKRGHTNDPTQQINSLMSKFQEAAQELKQVCELVRLAGTTAMPVIDYSDHGTTTASNYNKKRTKSSGQRRKHYELVSTQLELLAKERMERLKGELETRSQVLRDQTNRRKLLATGAAAGGAGGGMTANGTSNGPPRTTATTSTRLTQPSRLPPNSNPKNASSQFQSPLFTATSGGGGSNGVQRRGNANKNTSSASSAAGYSGYAGYGGTTNNNTAPSASSAGYGGTTTHTGYGGGISSTKPSSSAPSFATGIRQRKQQQQSRIQIDHGNDDDKYNKDNNSTTTATVQQQIQERRQNRAAQSRLASARLAEKSIAELGVMFTKMSTLISQQGEVLERIEDDVEAAGMDIDAGHDELVKVYGMTKGNRGLILKVFGILIFLIVFMKLY